MKTSLLFLMLSLVLFSTFVLQQNVFAITNSYSFSPSSVSVEQGQASSLNLVAVKTKDSGSNTELYVQILRPDGSKIDGSNPFFTAIKVNSVDVLSETNFSNYIFFPVVADTYYSSSVSIPITFSIKQSAPAGIYKIRLVGWYDSETPLATAQLIVNSASSQTPTPTPTGPQIIVTELKAIPKNTVEGNDVSFLVTVKNIGDAPGKKTLMVLVEKSDKSYSLNIPGTTTIDVLPGGTSVINNAIWSSTYPGNFVASVDGFSDKFTINPKSTTQNPSQTTPTTPEPKKQDGKPNIVVTGITFVPRKDIKVGTLIDIHVIVKNTGTAKGTKSIDGFSTTIVNREEIRRWVLSPQEVSLDAGKETELIWKQYPVMNAGLWDVNVDGVTNSFSAQESKQKTKDGNSQSGAKITNDKDQTTTPPTKTAKFCGPDITEQFVDSLKEIKERSDSLSSDNKGAYDGSKFLKKNGGNMDFQCNALREDGKSVCPTDPDCKSTVSLCNQCVMSHIPNDILFGFAAYNVDVSSGIQGAGGHAWDILNRFKLDAVESQAAYVVGSETARIVQEGQKLDKTTLCTTISLLSVGKGMGDEKKVTELFNKETDKTQTCQVCPLKDKPRIWKDFSKMPWFLNDGTTQKPKSAYQGEDIDEEKTPSGGSGGGGGSGNKDGGAPGGISKTKDSEPKVKGPKIVITGLTVNPKKITDRFDDTVTIQVKVKNIGDTTGKKTVKVLVQTIDGRYPFFSSNDPPVSVEPGSTVTIPLKSYAVFNGKWTAEIEDFSDTFEVAGHDDSTKPPIFPPDYKGEPYIVVTKTEIVPRKNIKVGTLVDVYATVKNIGEAKGTKSIGGNGFLDNSLRSGPIWVFPLKEVTLDPGKETVLNWKQNKVPDSGLGHISIDNFWDTFLVHESESSLPIDDTQEKRDKKNPKSEKNESEDGTSQNPDSVLDDLDSFKGKKTSKPDPGNKENKKKLPERSIWTPFLDMFGGENILEGGVNTVTPLNETKEKSKLSDLEEQNDQKKTKEKKHKSTKIDIKSDKKKIVIPVKKTDTKTKSK